jgi:hypothetical protein
MLKRLAVMAVTAFVAIGVSGQPNKGADSKQNKSEQQPTSLLHAVGECPPANNTTYHEAKPDSDPPKWYAPLERPEGWAVIVGLLTLGAVCYQALLSRDTARRQLRAYVCVSGATIAFRQLDAPDIKVDMRNGGLTPAYEMRYWIGISIGSYPLNQPLPSPPVDFQTGASVMPPSGVEFMPAQWSHPIPIGILSELGTPKRTLYVHGKATYMDAFGKKRFTEFRLMFGGPEQVGLEERDGALSGRLKPDTEGNRAN